MCRAIQEIRPTWVVGENVAGLATMVEGGLLTEVGEETPLFEPDNIIHGYELEQTFTIERICSDLEHIGYSVQPMLIPAAAVGAPHRRDRIFIIAHTEDSNYDGRGQREYEVEGNQRDFRHPCSGDSQRLRPEAGADAPNPNGSNDLRVARKDEGACKEERLSERHEVRVAGKPINVRQTPDGFTSDSAGKRRGEVLQHLQPKLANGAEPLGLSRLRSSADANRTGREESEQPGRKTDCSQAGAGMDDRIIRPCRDGHSSDAFRKRLSAAIQRGCYGAEERDGTRRPTQFASDDAWLKGTWWDNFPTVPPVHRGNDGLPFRLDDLTIPATKWRTESLKAYGNAIVPQVMFRIFQAIDKL